VNLDKSPRSRGLKKSPLGNLAAGRGSTAAVHSKPSSLPPVTDLVEFHQTVNPFDKLLFGDLSDNPAGVASGEDPIGHIPCDNATSPNDRSGADSDPRTDDRTAANPYV